MFASPNRLSPRLQTKSLKNTAKYHTSAKQNWRDWKTFEDALTNASPTQVLAWTSFADYRLIINNHKTFNHMVEWQQALNTGMDSRYLQAIAGTDTLILSPRESAKAQPLTELVLTPSGWRCMGELKEGDFVVAGDGTPTQVTHVQPRGVKSCYRITFTDGATVDCSDDHLWTVRNLAGADLKKFYTVPLSQIRTKVFVSAKWIKSDPVRICEVVYREAKEGEKPWLDGRGYPKFFIPIVSPIDFPKRQFIVNPYLLGVLIGDGSLKGQCSPAFSTGDLEIIELLEQVLPESYTIKQKGSSNNYTITKSIKKGCPLANVINDELRRLGLFERGSVDKFIPKEYLFSSVEDRVALLQGLMDTDGTVASKCRGGGNISFCSVSTQLISDIVALVRSLGGTATVQKPQRNWYTHNGEKKQGQVSYKVGIKLPEGINPFRLSRKACLYAPCTQYKPTRGIINIEYVGEAEMQCITIAHPSQLYVTRDYIVTHNSTYLAQWVSYQFGLHLSPWMRLALKVLGVSYNIDTAMPRSRQIQAIIESTKYQEIFPWCRPSKKKWGEKEWMLDLQHAGLPTTEEQYSYVCAGLTGAINSRRCVVGSTLVRTPQGLIPISEIYQHLGEWVLTWNINTQEKQWCKLQAVASRDASQVIEITTRQNRKLQCTPDHRIFVLGQGYKEAQDLELGDRLVVESGVDFVQAIAPAPPQKVYDIQVASNHNFFANDILCHNCHLVLLDDLIKSPEAIRAQSVRDAMVSNWENVIQFTRYDGSRAVCLGTRMTADDIYCTTFTTEKGWNVIEQSALLEREDGTEYSFWEPEHDKAPGMPLRRLQEERERTPIAFSFQRQNRIVRVKEQSINPELIKRGTIPTRFDSLVLSCDLSAGRKESNDYTAMVLGGMVRGVDRNPDQYWVVDCWEDRIMGNLEKLDAMIEIWEMWSHLLPTTKMYNPETGEWSDRPEQGLNLFFDSSAYGLSLQGDYEDYIVGQKKITDWRVHPVPASGRGDKLYRLRKHTGLFTNGLIYFNMYGRTMSDGRRPMGRLIQQITEFGSTSHDDLADAFELCMTGLRSYQPMTRGSY